MSHNVPNPSCCSESQNLCNKCQGIHNIQQRVLNPQSESSPLPLPVMNWAADDEPAGQHVHWQDKPTLNVGVMNQADSNGLALPSIDWSAPAERY